MPTQHREMKTRPNLTIPGQAAIEQFFNRLAGLRGWVERVFEEDCDTRYYNAFLRDRAASDILTTPGALPSTIRAELVSRISNTEVSASNIDAIEKLLADIARCANRDVAQYSYPKFNRQLGTHLTITGHRKMVEFINAQQLRQSVKIGNSNLMLFRKSPSEVCINTGRGQPGIVLMLQNNGSIIVCNNISADGKLLGEKRAAFLRNMIKQVDAVINEPVADLSTSPIAAR